MELDLVPNIIVEEQVELRLQHGFQFLWCMDMKRGRSSQESESTDKADKSETVVTMYVRDKDMA